MHGYDLHEYAYVKVCKPKGIVWLSFYFAIEASKGTDFPPSVPHDTFLPCVLHVLLHLVLSSLRMHALPLILVLLIVPH